MSQSGNLVTLLYRADAKIVLTRILNMLNQSRSERGVTPFTAVNVALGHIEASADGYGIDLAYRADDMPPQVSIILSNSNAQDEAAQLELAILSQYLVKRQSIETVVWPFTQSHLTAQEFSECVIWVIHDVINLIDGGVCEYPDTSTIDDLFLMHFPIKRAPVKTRRDRPRSTARPAEGTHKEFVDLVLSNVEDGPVAAASRATETMDGKSAVYRLAAWALAFTVALLCWPLAIPLIANNLRNGESVRTGALAIGAVGLLAALGLAVA
ncbi:MAG: hypothetical protein ACRBB0_24950 [Pelagimonas sp.]|uniref:hypothetical protein n=1 Tax=Pelagimonas sp. TaxID=2073170 RepID=UPI003D6A8AD7